MSKCKTERLDRLLSNLGYGSRKDVAHWIKEGLITVDDQPAKSASRKVEADSVRIEGKPLDHPDGLTLIYHKATGSVCSHKETGLLIYADFPERWSDRKPPLSSVGRLDKETSGLLILTDDGHLNHHLTSPKHHVSKTYAVKLDSPLSGSEQDVFASGRLMLEGDEKPCLPAEMTVINENEATLVLHEGRYHQVRRMFAAVGNRVTQLARIRIGALTLEQTGLEAGEYRTVTPDALINMISPR
ncbi:MAG: rRNA pseudouridine synthase [Mariprofundaceae bacterium]|nr:rRNA pseudouridine synthase [Mariprofundaceae bacterium]